MTKIDTSVAPAPAPTPASASEARPPSSLTPATIVPQRTSRTISNATDTKDKDVGTVDGDAAHDGDGKEKEHWLQRDTQVIPKNNLPIVCSGLMLCVFLAAIDQTIVSTALPSIATDLQLSTDGYSWVGSAYLLCSSAMIPLYGRMSDIVGRKPLLFFAIAVFLFGSGLCGAAQNTIWICACRGVQGIGGGGIISLVQISISDIIPLHKRGAFQGLFGAVWGLASVLGPLIGGALTDKTALSWRWCFLINLPSGGIAAAVLYPSLHLNPTKRKSFRSIFREFDFVGYFLLLAAIVIFLFGFSQAENKGFDQPSSIALIVVGGCLFPLPVFWGSFLEKRYPHVRPMLPPRLFRTRTTGLILITVVMHAVPFFAYTYELPIYFQAVRGASATFSGVLMFPYALIGSIISACAGVVIVKMKKWRPTFWYGWTLSIIGYGMMSRIDAETSLAYVEVSSAVAALGYGALFQTPLLGLLSAMPNKEQAATTSTMTLTRSLSGAVGIAIGGAIFNSKAVTLTQDIPGYDPPANPSENLRGLKDLQPPSLSKEVIHQYGQAMNTVFLAMAPIIAVGFLASLGVKGYSMQRNNVHAGATPDKKGNEGEGEGEAQAEEAEVERAGQEGREANEDVEAQVQPSRAGESPAADADAADADLEKAERRGVSRLDDQPNTAEATRVHTPAPGLDEAEEAKGEAGVEVAAKA